MNWDDIINKRFENKQEKATGFTFESLMEEIDRVSEFLAENKEKVFIKEDAAAAKKFLLTVPKLQPSESWGDPNSVGHKQARKFFSKIRGASITERIQSVNGVLEQSRKLTKPGSVISYLVFLESLAAVIRDFSASSAGFVFEGFLAALLGGEQIADPEGGSLPIEDIVDSKGDPISLKLLKGEAGRKTPIHGSFKNLVDGLNKFPQGVRYVVVSKTGKGGGELEFWEFWINQGNIDDIGKFERNRPLFELDEEAIKGTVWEKQLNKLNQASKNKKEKPIWTAEFVLDQLEQLGTDWSTAYDLLQKTKGYTKDSGDEEAPLKEAKGGGAKTQWTITQDEMKKGAAPDMGSQKLGNLNVTEEGVLDAAELLMTYLQKSVIDLMQSVYDLNQNINGYFQNDKRTDAIKRGEQAAKDADKVEDNITGVVEQEKSEKDS